MTTEFLKLSKEHFDALKILQRAYKREIGEDEPSEEDLNRLLPAMESGAILFYGCAVSGKLVACCSVSPTCSTFDYRRSGVFEDFYIRPEYRRQGIARRLVAECEQWARERGCTEFASDCELTNTASLRFHLSVGFREENRIICFRKTLYAFGYGYD